MRNEDERMKSKISFIFLFCKRKRNKIFIFFLYKVFMLSIIMQLDISAKLTPQVTIIIYEKILLKEKTKRKKIQKKNMGD